MYHAVYPADLEIVIARIRVMEQHTRYLEVRMEDVQRGVEGIDYLLQSRDPEGSNPTEEVGERHP